MLLYVLALSDFINFALKRDSPRATSPRPEWTINSSLSTIQFLTKNGLTDNVCSLQTYLLTRLLINLSTQEIINSFRGNP